MDSVCKRRWSSGTRAVVFLHTLALSWAGAVEPAPKIDGHRQTVMTLRENMIHRFNCHSDGWHTRAPTLLTWYLNGERQRPRSPKGSRGMTPHKDSEVTRLRANSTFSLRARKWDRELVCVALNPKSGESHNATVTLNVQFQPEIVRVSAHSSEISDPGLLLVLFALVQSNPPATFTLADQSGLLVANTSDIFILDSHSYPWLTNHTMRVTLSSLSGNISLNASNSVGTAQSNITLAEFLQSRVEVPMLGIVTGGSMAFMALLILSLIVLCLMQKPTSKSIDETAEILMTKKSDSTNLKAERTYIPRENMSLPSNMQLNDLSALKKEVPLSQWDDRMMLGISQWQSNYKYAAFRNLGAESCNSYSRENTQLVIGGEKKTDEEDEDLSLAYAARGFARYPMVGYIYKVNSTSSEEIWL